MIYNISSINHKYITILKRRPTVHNFVLRNENAIASYFHLI